MNPLIETESAASPVPPRWRARWRVWALGGGAALIVAVLAAAIIYAYLAARSSSASQQELEAIHDELTRIRELLEQQNQDQEQGPDDTQVHQVARETPDPPPPGQVRLSIQGYPALGNPRAPAVLVEFTDFQCPFCARFHAESFDRIRHDFIDPGRLRYVVVDYPLSFHKLALGAAQASHCAEQQGRYWPAHDALFRQGGQLQPAQVRSLMGTLGLDLAAFDACIQKDTFRSRVLRDRAIGFGIGVEATPTFLLGRLRGNTVQGRLIIGAEPFDVFDRAIQAVLDGG